MSKHRHPTARRLITALAFPRLLVLLLAPFLAALDYGGVLPWTQWALTLSAALILLLTLPELMIVRRPTTAMLVSLCVLAAIGGLLQSVRVPGTVTSFLSPGSSTAYESIPPYLRSEAESSTDANLQKLARPTMAISVSPSRTWTWCTIPILFAVFLLGSAYSFNTKSRLAVLLFSLAISGAVIAFTGIAHRINPDIAENVEASRGEDRAVQSFATFVNRNNAAAYLNLCLAASIGCLVWRYRRQRKLRPWDDRFDFDDATAWEAVKERIRQFISCVDTSIILLLLFAGLILAGVFVGGSRGGMLGVMGGVIAATIHPGEKKQARFFAATAAVLVTLIFGVLVLSGSLDQVTERTSTLWQEDFSETARWNHWRDAVPTAWQYMPAGAGLGAYRYAYLPYQQHSDGVWFLNADNLYLEMIVEGGLWMPLLLLLALFLIVRSIRQLSSIQESTTANVIVAFSSFMAGAIGLSQFFDFGALLPANYLTIAVLTGVLVGYADRRSYRAQPPKKKRKRRRRSSRSHAHGDRPHATHRSERRQTRSSSRSATSSTKANSSSKTWEQHPLNRFFSSWFVNPILAATLLAFLFFLARDGRARAEVDYWNRTAQSYFGPDWAENVPIPQPLVQLGNERPGDAETQLTLAQWRILANRAAAVRLTLHRPTSLSPTPQRAWSNSDQRVLRAVYYSSDSADRMKAMAAIVPPDGLKELELARSSALSALLGNPLDVAARELLLQLDFLAPVTSDNNPLFQQIGQLRRNYSPTLHQTAKLAFVHPGPETACKLWRRALEVDPDFLDMYWRDIQALVEESQFINAIPDDPYLSLRFAQLAKDPEVKAEMLSRAKQQLSAVTPAPDEQPLYHFTRGRIAEMQHDFTAAEQHFAKAVEGDPSATEWRFRYVLSLENNEKWAVAQDQIRRCLLQDPKNSAYRKKESALKKH